MTLADFSLEGRVALVTGASKGLGAEIARVMAEAGADVVASARDMTGLQATAAAVAERGRKCHVVRTDVTVEAELRQMVDEARSGGWTFSST
jgi:NAD(P)-dependent dehydrogenase (short-subunit alcohol dehydrogenase family)